MSRQSDNSPNRSANPPSPNDAGEESGAREERQTREPEDRRFHRGHYIHFWYFFLALWGVFLFRTYVAEVAGVEQLQYSEFLASVEEGRIVDAVVSNEIIHGQLRPEEGGDSPRAYRTVRVDPEIAEHLRKHGVETRGVVESTFLTDMLGWIIPMVLFLAVWMFFIRKLAERQGMGGGFMAIGRSKARIYVEEKTRVRFEDVAGVEEATEELQEIVRFLQEPARYGRLGGRLPKGILLVGPPGTGKTLLARAVAGEAEVPFFSISGSEFVEMFVGVGAARVRDLFEQARKRAPCIIFIDELDALGRARSIGGPGGGHDEKEQTLNQLLSELDGFDPSQGVILLAATNRPEILDPALLRAGRFDRQILVDRPDKTGRAKILKIHSRKIKLAADVNLEQIAAITPGFTGADLANLVNEAALLATRREAEFVATRDFNEAIERIIAGLEKKNRILNEVERRTVAYHETGHALAALMLPGCEPVVKVSIIPRGIGALGYTLQRPLEDRYLMNINELKNKLIVLLAGRASEEIAFHCASTGAADDFSKATDIARNMVVRYGMDDTLGLVAYESDPEPFLTLEWQSSYGRKRLYSERTAHDIDRAVRALIDEAYQQAVTILQKHLPLLHSAAALLLERESLLKDDLYQLYTEFKESGELPAEL